jgi:hypothetical protein
VLVYLKVQKIDIANVRCALFLASYLHADLYQLTETYSVEKVKEILGDVVTKCFNRANAQQMSEGYIKLERGFATIPLPGIEALCRSVHVRVKFSCLMFCP